MIVLPSLSALLEVVPAAIVAGVLLLAATALRAWSLQRAAAGLAIGTGCAVAIGLLLGRLPEVPAIGIPVSDWPFHLAMAGAAVGVVLSSSHVGWPIRCLVAIASMIGLSFLLLDPVAEAGSKETLAVAGVGGLAWILLDGLAERRRGPTLPVVLTTASFFAVQAMLHGRSGEIGELAAPLTAAFAAAIGVALLIRSVSVARGGIAVYSVLLTGCLMISAYFDTLPLASGAILLAAPSAAWVGEIPWLGRRHRVLRIGVSVALVTAVSLAAVYLASDANPPDEYASY